MLTHAVLVRQGPVHGGDGCTVSARGRVSGRGGLVFDDMPLDLIRARRGKPPPGRGWRRWEGGSQVYAPAHVSVALVGKRLLPDASLLGLMIAAQGSEIVWIVLSYAGVEHQAVDAAGRLHLDYLPWSHSIVTGLGGGIVVGAVLAWGFRRPRLGVIFGAVFASHIVLDVIQHEPNIQLAPGVPVPVLGLNLAAIPLADFAVELALSLACWAYFRGSWTLLAVLVGLNLTNLPLMLTSDARPLAAYPAILPTVIAVQTFLSITLVWLAARRRSAELSELIRIDRSDVGGRQP